MTCSTTIDHILVLRRHRNNIKSTRVYPSYSFRTTLHRLLGGYLCLCLYAAPHARLKVERRYNTQLLHDPSNVKLSA
jgi:hypothetical protein